MQRKFILMGMMLLAGFAISGCANNRDLIAKASLATRNDVFTEAVSPETHSRKAIIDINFAVKSNSSRFMEIYNKHSNPPYRVHVNIDGQTTILEAQPILEDKSSADANLPESGTGWKYQFSTRIALTPGTHNLTIALPIDDVIVEREIELHAGTNTITMTPVYNKRSFRPYKRQNFTAGVKTLEITVH